MRRSIYAQLRYLVRKEGLNQLVLHKSSEGICLGYCEGLREHMEQLPRVVLGLQGEDRRTQKATNSRRKDTICPMYLSTGSIDSSG